MKRTLLVTMALAAAAFAQTKWPNELTVWFPDGTGLEIHTESSGASAPVSTRGSIAAREGREVHRVVFDKDGKILFGYNLQARKMRDGGAFSLRIEPLDSAQFGMYGTNAGAPQPFPTVSGKREFPPLRVGDAVQLEILQNPGTGAKIWDVLKIAGFRPSQNATSAAREKFSLEDFRVTINAKTVVAEDPVWMLGGGIMMQLPGHGRYYLTLAPPPASPAFEPSGWADHNVLRIRAGEDLIEITGKRNVLESSDYGTVWVYQDPRGAELRKQLAERRKVYGPNHPDVLGPGIRLEYVEGKTVAFHCADSVETLLKDYPVVNE